MASMILRDPATPPPSDPAAERDAALRRGAGTFIGLLEVIKGMTETAFEDCRRTSAGRESSDPRDYAAVATAVRGALLHNLGHHDEAQREGFARALTDLLCMAVDGASPTTGGWDPIANTAASFTWREGAKETGPMPGAAGPGDGLVSLHAERSHKGAKPC